MYLARKIISGVPHYYIRESYWDGEHYLSRDLFDLGSSPGNHIIYPGGNAFYVDPDIEDQLEARGVDLQADDLEDIFWPFLKPRIQHAVEHFRNRGKRSTQTQAPRGSAKTNLPVHNFDKRRLHYLKFGRMEQGYLWLTPEKVFDILRHKSRDELEQQFMEMERQLNPREYKAYVYVIFDIKRFFSQSFAARRPQFLKQSDIDAYFDAEICKLNRDAVFWAGMPGDGWLHEYLTRYLFMFYDYDFAPRSWMEDYVRNFINSRRDHQFPSRTASVSMKEASTIFDETEKTLKKMSRQELSRLFRRRARDLHPDKGGKQEKFVELTRAYDSLLRSKKR
ncbi:MAG: J domain-containing protein [Deltaproteobacteria bacterium]|jgi:hypothetical protein|nr:J domain-containing protein [Deltaproteobacteria bacterium]